ncbi:Spore germination protein [compost metagenome]
MNMNNMLPFMEKGIGPSLKGSVIVEGWFCQFMLISFLYPSLSDKHKAMKVGFISVLATCITMVLTNLAVLLLLGSYITANFHYPVLLASRYIMIADFIEHVEAMIMMVWVLGAFLKISFLTYTIAVGAAEWLQLDGYRHLVFPVGILISVMSMWIAPNMQELTKFIATSGTVYIITGYLGLPLLLLGIASVRRLR